MLQKLRILSIAVCLCFSSSPSNAQSASVPGSRVAALQHGVNLGRFHDGIFENDGYACCSEDDLKLVHKLGFDHVRILLVPGKIFDSLKPEAIHGPTLDQLDTTVRNCLQAGLSVILAMSLEEDRFKGKLGSDDNFAADFAVFWKALAAHYSTSGFPADRLFFEILNEPDIENNQWSEIQTRLAAAIRQGAKENTILASGTQNADLLGLLMLLRVLQDTNVIYVFHYYEPYSFTHQGENWNDKFARLLPGGSVKYPFAASSVKDAASHVPDLIQRLNASHDMQLSSRSRIQSDIDAIGIWSEQQGVTVICDEFGVIRTNPDIKDRSRWIKDVREFLHQRHIGWTVWDYSSDSFGIRSKSSGWDKHVIGALGLKHP